MHASCYLRTIDTKGNGTFHRARSRRRAGPGLLRWVDRAQLIC